VSVLRFPDGFIWGAATSAYQVEGAVTSGGRGESIWDRFCHTPGRVHAGDTGDVACDHYHRYREDVALMAELGLGGYRFSIAWPRIQPTGRGAPVAEGLDLYERLVDALLERGIRPFATLYHWDLPQALEDAGGWPSRDTTEAFAGYADIVARRLGDRLASLATFNEPWCIAELGYRTGEHAPGRRDAAAAFAAGHHVLVAHGLAVAAIRAAAPQLPVGIVLNFAPKHPATGHPLDLEAASIAHDRMNRWYLDPITGGDYPGGGGRAAGWQRAEVRDGDMDLAASPIDFMGVNYYSREVIRSPRLPPVPTSSTMDRTSMGWEVYPEGLTEILQLVASRTLALPLYVTENGAAEERGIHDPRRTSYVHRHLVAVHAAIASGVPVKGWFAWSLLDNFEWAHGYAYRFGLVGVDFTTQERSVRDSGRFLASVARDGLPVPGTGVIGGTR
jgi:beta-glucosidase